MPQSRDIESLQSVEYLLALIETFRVGLRQAISPYRVLGSITRNQYQKIRGQLLASPLTAPHLPGWLREAEDLPQALALIRAASHGAGRVLKRWRQTIDDSLVPLIDSLEMLNAIDTAKPAGQWRTQAHINAFFGISINAEQRAMQALAVPPMDLGRGGINRFAALWRNVLLFYPALAAAFERMLPTVGVSYQELIQHISDLNLGKDSKDTDRAFISGILRRSFGVSRGQFGSRTWTLNSYGERVRSSAQLTAVDLLAASIFSPDTGYYEIPPIAVRLRKLKASGQQFSQVSRELVEGLRQVLDQVRLLDMSSGNQQFAVINDRTGIKIVPFGTWSFCQSPSNAIPEQAFRGNVSQPNSPFSSDSLGELEELVQASALEGEFQKFFERHPEYLETLGPYSRVYPHLVLTEDHGNRLVPDFFLENLHTGFCDICDLKRPTDILFKENSGRAQFRDRVMAGVRQLNNYRDYFEDRDNRRKFEEAYPGLRAFRPRVLLVIGRQESLFDEIERIRLASELRDWVAIHTYDDIVKSARSWRLKMSEWMTPAPEGTV